MHRRKKLKQDLFNKFIKQIDFDVIERCIINRTPLPPIEYEMNRKFRRLEMIYLKYIINDTM